MPTNFTEIVFSQEAHAYTYHGRPLTSVSRIISQLKPPFDREGVAAKSAAKRGVSVAEILAEWDTASKTALAKGTRVHEWITKKLRGEAEPQGDMFLALNQRLPEMDAFERFWNEKPIDAPPVHIEWVVGDAELGIAGTADAVLVGPYGTHLFDWKTGAKFTTENRFQKLLAPFDDLDDCELNSYSLQLSLYRLMIERNTDLELDNSYIVHLTTEGEYRLHRALDLRERLGAWVEG